MIKSILLNFLIIGGLTVSSLSYANDVKDNEQKTENMTAASDNQSSHKEIDNKKNIASQEPVTIDVDKMKNTENIKYNSNVNFNDLTRCGDFLETTKMDNLSNDDTRRNKPEDVYNHTKQLEIMLSPYFVRNQDGQIYPPALNYLLYNTSKLCWEKPSMPLINSIRITASNLAKMVSIANNEAKKDIMNNQ